MEISTKIGVEVNQPIAQQTHEPKDNPQEGSGKRPPYQEIDDMSVNAEVLTKSDLEIRKIHALRRSKEYIEAQLLSAAREAEKSILSGSAGDESAAEKEYKARFGGAPFGVDIVNESDDPEKADNEASYKIGTAISGYRTYKKETPKAWEDSDVDERR